MPTASSWIRCRIRSSAIPPARWLGLNTLELVHHDDLESGTRHARPVARASPSDRCASSCAFVIRTAAGADSTCVMTNHLDDPVVCGIIVNGHDVTERVDAERELIESEAEFRFLAERASDMIYRFRTTGDLGYEYISPACEELTGFTPADYYADPELMLNRLHPDDRHVAIDASGASRLRERRHATDADAHAPQERDVDLDRTPNGPRPRRAGRHDRRRRHRPRHHQAGACRGRDPGARVLLPLGARIDPGTGDRRRRRRDHPRGECRLDRGAVGHDDDLGSGNVGTNYLALCDDEASRGVPGSAQAAAGLRAVLSGAEEGFRLDYPIYGPDEERWFMLRVSPLRTATGGAIVHHLDITDRKVYEQQLARQAIRDPLTGLANRALLADRLEGALAASASTGADGRLAGARPRPFQHRQRRPRPRRGRRPARGRRGPAPQARTSRRHAGASRWRRVRRALRRAHRDQAAGALAERIVNVFSEPLREVGARP